jgi:putative endonuclease
MPRQFYVYILANRSRTLYVGVTNDITRRVLHHRAGVASRFTSRYGITRLVSVETTNTPQDAIAREKQIKGWSRAKKVALIETANPSWDDLAKGWFENEDDLCREARESFRRRQPSGGQNSRVTNHHGRDPSTGTVAMPRSAPG